ncbi:gp53-like domain-containing protein [Bombella apis]|uniref:gp53-like domain-containing protein n=1 Tax=Bombella apis TaxID=1785988 RepID=UPI0012B72CC9|nr:hypothetical protein [Bombella apis]MPW00107.1 hypothetical protein [Bombella apis]
MGNSNWPTFPGLPNMTQDGDGRPQVLDLIPGKQRGTPLNAFLFNPLIRSICDLRDGQDRLGQSSFVPSQPREGHNDSVVNNLGYQNENGGIPYLSVVGKGLIFLQPAGDFALNSDLTAERERAQAVEATMVPSQPREGHNDSVVNNLGYQNENGGIPYLSVAGKGLIFLQPAGDFALNSDLTAERERAQAVEATMVPSQPREGHNDSVVNNLGYQNENGGIPYLSVVGKGLIFLQPAGDFALNSDLTAERERAQAVEATMVPSQPREGHNDGAVNNFGFDQADGRPWVSLVGRGIVKLLGLSEFAWWLDQNGYVRLPGGLLIQWGYRASSNGTFKFPTPFKEKCFVLIASNADAQGQFVDAAYGWPVDAENFFIGTKSSSTGEKNGFAVSWIAFGK